MTCNIPISSTDTITPNTTEYKHIVHICTIIGAASGLTPYILMELPSTNHFIRIIANIHDYSKTMQAKDCFTLLEEQEIFTTETEFYSNCDSFIKTICSIPSQTKNSLDYSTLIGIQVMCSMNMDSFQDTPDY